MGKILVVDDHKKTVNLIKMFLEKDSFTVLEAYNGRQALEIARHASPDLVILDLMLPKVDGLDVCRILRSESKVPIIMLTARATEEDILLGLDLGADDYITKPFSPRQLAARVRAVLRRTADEQENKFTVLRCGDLVIDGVRHEARIRDELIHLTPKEFKLLEIMSKEAGRAFSRQQLLEEAFESNYEGLDRSVDGHIMNLRKKIEPDPENPTYIQTVFGIGYRFGVEPDVS